MPDLVAQYIPTLLNVVGQLVIAALFLFIGLRLITVFGKFLKKILTRQHFDPSLVRFGVSLVTNVLKILLFISALGVLGVETTSFIALIGAAGIAIGAALSGTLQNFASGVMILIFKPFKVGDLIEAQDVKGAVSEIEIFNTILKTSDHATIIVPNSQITSGIITNHSTEEFRRVDLRFGISYTDDMDRAKEVIHEVLANNPYVIKEKLAVVEVIELADSSVNFLVAPWVRQEDYIPYTTTISQSIKAAFDAAGISIPFPQQDVYLHRRK